MKTNLRMAEFHLSAACFQNIFQDSSNKFWFCPKSIVRNYKNEKIIRCYVYSSSSRRSVVDPKLTFAINFGLFFFPLSQVYATNV